MQFFANYCNILQFLKSIFLISWRNVASMLKEERLDFILQKLKTNHSVKLESLSADLNVSEDTIRRDIEFLSCKGLLLKVRGGAVPHSPNARSFKERIHVSERDKQAVAKKAFALVEPGQTILLDGGTTTYTLATMIPQNFKLTVITNNIPIAAVLMDHPHTEVILAGGRIFKNSQVTVGVETIRMLQQIRVDTCFIGICSLHHELGVSTPDYDETEVKRIMVQQANKVVAVTTQNKIGTAESYKVCDIRAVHTIITETNPAEKLFAAYKKLGIHII